MTTATPKKKAARRRSKESLYANEKHKILREVYRNYLEYREYVQKTGHDVIEYSVETERGSGQYTRITISFSDLKKGVSDLAPRKQEAFYLFVICGLLQREVADIMQVTTVTVGQYADAALRQLAKAYFVDEDTKTLTLSSERSLKE